MNSHATSSSLEHNAQTQLETGQPHSKLSREDVLRMIEENGGSQGLDLSTYDLSGVDLSALDLRGVVFGTDWRTPHLSTACLKGAFLEKCELQGSSFIHVDLSDISFYDSNLEYAVLGVANCTGTSFRQANLRGVNFHGAHLDKTDLIEADLRDSDFHSAYIGEIDLSRAHIGDRLVFEDYGAYHEFLRRHNVEDQRIAECLATRFDLARHTYLVLKNAFLNKGQYDQAGWAYIKERQMEKATHLATQSRAKVLS